jgi:predicted nucleic acid-binding protein
VTSLLARETVSIVYAGRETAEQYARLFVQLKRAGTPLPDNDLWIAALALEHDLTLITRDLHFESLPQLRRIMPNDTGTQS